MIFLVGEEPYEQRVPAHSWVLAAKSPVFRIMFRGPLAPRTRSNTQQSAEQPETLFPPAVSLEKVAAEEEEEQEVSTQFEAPVTVEASDNSNDDIQVDESPVQEDKKSPGPKEEEEEEVIIATIELPSIIVVDTTTTTAKEDEIEMASSTSSIRSGWSVTSTQQASPVPQPPPPQPPPSLGRATIAVSDVDGRAFDILLRYLYNETVNLQSVMTALTTLYAAHKYMCPGLAKQVVRYLKENLTDKNVLLVLQHICLYCSAASKTSSDHDWDPPITVGPTSSRVRSSSLSSAPRSSEDLHAPSAPPLPTITEQEEEAPLLTDSADEDDMDEEDDEDMREFEAGMAVSDSSDTNNKKVGGGKVNCCDALLKQCLELIDAEASVVLAGEDVEDLDISALNMIVCRETLCLKSGEVEVFSALKRWSTRECKRQRLELTAANRRKVLEGAQYLLRYLTMSREDFLAGPHAFGLLTKEEAEALLSHLGGANLEQVDLPDHLLQWQSIMRRPRRGKEPPHGITISDRKHSRRFSRPRPSVSSNYSRRRSTLPIIAQPVSPAGAKTKNKSGVMKDNAKDNKFNFIEEFFVCLACIFD